MLQQLRASIVSVLLLTLVTGIVFPFVIFGLGKAVFPRQAEGSLIKVNGEVVGSELIGQNFANPGYFHPRPSANSYAADNSGGTNLAPTSKKLMEGIHSGKKDDPGDYDGIKDLAAAYRKENIQADGSPLPDSVAIPTDAVTRSASGLDPDISPANADLQVYRVAKARSVSIEQVRQLLAQNTQGRTFGLLGEPRVNVLKLNVALDGLAPLKK
ncbi:MAG: K+-transporting ATPase, subunit [Chthonomonadales bacterium]|nr:K+-transporting ATPase, subunit [Chthonomonadales bacterium]